MMYGTSNATDQSLADSHSIKAQLSCLIEGHSPVQRDQTRAQTIEALGLSRSESVPIFDEATQTVSRLLAMPISILSVVDTETQHFKSVVGLSSLGLMNQLAAARRIPRQESFCTQAIDSGKTFALENATAHPAFSRSLLVQQYGIQSYLGAPLMTAEGCCIGTLAVMDLMPHQFSEQEIAFLELTARWCMSEFENRQAIAKLQQGIHPLQSSQAGGTDAQNDTDQAPLLSRLNQVRFDLIVQLTQDLRNPLTSISGMANMLSREIYGPLSEKQQEYTNIVLSSSQQMLGMVDEIVEVGELKEADSQLSLASVDIEMISQQAIAALEALSQQQDLQIKLTVEPGSRIWNLDKRIVRQLIYHLIFSIIKMSTAGSTIRLHISRKASSISLALWVSNPWLGEDLPQAVIAWGQKNKSLSPKSTTFSANSVITNSVATASDTSFSLNRSAQANTSRQELGLLLSRYLTEMHGGEAIVQGSSATGYRYVITLPSLKLPSKDNLI